jgi:DNA-binding transcriptional MerR regulator
MESRLLSRNKPAIVERRAQEAIPAPEQASGDYLQMSDAAERLGVSVATLSRWIKQAGMVLTTRKEDRRSKCLSQAQLLLLALIHQRRLTSWRSREKLNLQTLRGDLLAMASQVDDLRHRIALLEQLTSTVIAKRRADLGDS